MTSKTEDQMRFNQDAELHCALQASRRATENVQHAVSRCDPKTLKTALKGKRNASH